METLPGPGSLMDVEPVVVWRGRMVSSKARAGIISPGSRAIAAVATTETRLRVDCRARVDLTQLGIRRLPGRNCRPAGRTVISVYTGGEGARNRLADAFETAGKISGRARNG